MIYLLSIVATKQYLLVEFQVYCQDFAAKDDLDELQYLHRMGGRNHLRWLMLASETVDLPILKG